MRGRTAQMSLLTLCHLSVTSPIQSSSNQTAQAAQAAREAERDKVGQGLSTRSRPGIMYMYVLVLPFVQIFFSIKENKREVGGCWEFFSGAAMLKTRGKENAARRQDRRAGVDEQQQAG